jgi:ABC-type antimicrobial peptide transport system permease subunit
VLVVAIVRKLFGVTLPHDWVGWLVTFTGFLAFLSVFQIAGAAFVAEHRGEEPSLTLSGYVLPVAWSSWGALLIYAHPTAFPVLLILFGLLVLLISAVMMRRAKARKIAASETGSA